MRKRVLVPAAFVTCAALAGAAMADVPATAPTTQPAGLSATQPATHPGTQPAAKTTAVKRGSLSFTIDQQGSFDPVDPFEVRLRPKAYSGELTITSIVPNGSLVKKGDTILEIDAAPLKRMLAAADNDLLNARAAVAKAEADDKVAQETDALTLDQQKRSLKEAEDALAYFEKMDGPQYLTLIDLQLQQMKDQMRDAQDELDQLKKMYKSEELTNATADIVVRRALRQAELAKQYYAMSQERAEKARTFSYPLLRQKYLDAAEQAKEQFTLFQSSQTQQKVMRQTGLAAVHAQEAAAELRDNELKSDLERLTVKAPADGIVSYGQILNGNWQGGDPRTLRAGERAMPQSVLMTVYTPGRLRLMLDLPENRYFAIKAGRKASISPVAYPELKYEGLCEAGQRTPIAGMGGATYALPIATGEVDGRLVPGMKATVHMEVPLAEDVLLVPTSAVSNSTVWVKLPDGKEESRHVLTGRTDGKSIEILSGVKEGDEVLTQAKPGA